MLNPPSLPSIKKDRDMSLPTPQQIKLRRRLDDQRPDLLCLHSDASDVTPDPSTNGPGRVRKVFRLMKHESGAVVPRKEYMSTPAINDAVTGLPRFVLTQSEPSRKRKIATFEAERPSKKIQAQDGSQIAITSVPDQPEVGTPSAPSTPARKRPGASTATVRLPTQPKIQNQQGPDPSTTREDDTFKSLLEEAQLGDAKSTEAAPASSKHRFLPKATTRLKDRIKSSPAIAGESMDLDGDSDMEYVYDTYILDEAMDYDIHAAEPGTVGLLHIDEEQQPIWDTYCDETDSDDERASDDEDSNAEDYYGADYPEDEVDSDDEYDVDAYKYRRGASDDEEYGSGDADYSDANDEIAVPKWPASTH